MCVPDRQKTVPTGAASMSACPLVIATPVHADPTGGRVVDVGTVTGGATGGAVVVVVGAAVVVVDRGVVVVVVVVTVAVW